MANWNPTNPNTWGQFFARWAIALAVLVAVLFGASVIGLWGSHGWGAWHLHAVPLSVSVPVPVP